MRNSRIIFGLILQVPCIVLLCCGGPVSGSSAWVGHVEDPAGETGAL